MNRQPHSPKYDGIIILGSGFRDETSWRVPMRTVEKTQIATTMYNKGLTKKVVVSGKWSLNWERKGIRPPHSEAQAIAQILHATIPQKDILIEDLSQDTIGNAVLLKKLLATNGLKKLLLCCDEYASERTQYIFNHIFGPEYQLSFLITPDPFRDTPQYKEIVGVQKKLLAEQKSLIDEIARNPERAETLYYQHITQEIRKGFDEGSLVAMGKEVGR